ncbi:MAG: hypothetical protein ACR2GU_13600 [Rubrobacteraceae bacterium]
MVGILAYGSLSDDPGKEISPLIVGRIRDTRTPFLVEFARRSRTRDGAPTLAPVSEGGDSVKASVLVLEEYVSEGEATDMLWRRETRREGSDEGYEATANPSPNTMLVRRLEDFEGVDVVLYAEIRANIQNLNPRKLAELAVCRSRAGREGRDGIAYLIGVKKNGVEMPMMPEYEREILRITGSESLGDAREMLIRPEP